MPYEYGTHEFDLTPEEQEKARWIREHCDEAAQRMIRMGESLDPWSPIRGAFEHFKKTFYADVCRRLQIQTWGDEGFAAFSLNPDCTKLVGYRVEKVKAKPLKPGTRPKKG